MLALLCYGLDLGCFLQSERCQEDSGCCIGCSLPAHLDKTDHPIHVKVGPALLPTETLTLESVDLAVSHVLPLLETANRPPDLRSRGTDPVRGPPSTSLS